MVARRIQAPSALKQITTFGSWCTAFLRYAGLYLAAHLQDAAGLIEHKRQVAYLHSKALSLAWKEFDVQFRRARKLAPALYLWGAMTDSFIYLAKRYSEWRRISATNSARRQLRRQSRSLPLSVSSLTLESVTVGTAVRSNTHIVSAMGRMVSSSAHVAQAPLGHSRAPQPPEPAHGGRVQATCLSPPGATRCFAESFEGYEVNLAARLVLSWRSLICMYLVMLGYGMF